MPSPWERALCALLALLMALPANVVVTLAQSSGARILVNEGGPSRSVVTNLTFSLTNGLVPVPGGVSVHRLPFGPAVDPTNLFLLSLEDTNAYRLSFTNLPGNRLPDGNYLASVLAAPETNPAGPRVSDVFPLFGFFGDHDGDRDVDFFDTWIFREAWTAIADETHRFDPQFDADADGRIGESDLTLFRSNYFTVLPAQPGVIAHLETDDGPGPSDRVTTVATVIGQVFTIHASTRVEAAFHAAADLSVARFEDISAEVTEGRFRFDSNRLAQLAGRLLENGAYEFSTRLVETNGEISAFHNLPITLGVECEGSFQSLADWKIEISAANPDGEPGTGSGSVTLEGCEALLSEGGSFRVAMSRDLTVPPGSGLLRIEFDTPSFDTSSAGAMRDAFEVALVDAASRPLTFTVQGAAGIAPAGVSQPPVLPASVDACFNYSDGNPPFVAPRAALTRSTGPGWQLSVDVSHLAQDSPLRLILRLVNNDKDRGSVVRIRSVRFLPSDPTLNLDGSPATAFSLIAGAARSAAAGNSSISPDCTDAPIRFNSGTPAASSRPDPSPGSPPDRAPDLEVTSPRDGSIAPAGTRLLLTGQATARPHPTLAFPPVSFEPTNGFTPEDGLRISDQFASVSGIRFSSDTGAMPYLARLGLPRTAFSSAFGEDTPASGQNNGEFFLTTERDGTNPPASLFVHFDQPVSRVSGEILDIDTSSSNRFAVFVSDNAVAYYNQSLGNRLDGTSELFPISTDPTINNAPEPDLAPVADILGDWLVAAPLPLNTNWALTEIPYSWPVTTETAVIYPIDAGPGGVRSAEANIGVDNGCFIWVNGVYKFGALAGGGVGRFEYANIDLGDLHPGTNYLQVLREDHGSVNGFVIEINGSLVPADGWLVQARDASDSVLESLIIDPGIPGAGDGLATPWEIQRQSPDIASLKISYAGTVDGEPDYAFDNFAAETTEPNQIALVTVNGRPVEALDAAGNFFDPLEIRVGRNLFEVVATDIFGQSATNIIAILGARCPQSFADLGAISTSLNPEYGRTSFHEWTQTLYADLALRNTGSYPMQSPLYVGITHISDPSVTLLEPDGISADGIPYYDFTATLAGTSLAPGGTSAARTLAFRNPNRVPFIYTLQILGQLNRAPQFTSTPPVAAAVGKPFRYDATATDPDGDTLGYSVPAGPSGMSVNPQTGFLTWPPLAEHLGNQEITLAVEDGRGGRAEQRFVITVSEPMSNRPPVFISRPITSIRIGSKTTSQGGSVILLGQDSDWHAEFGQHNLIGAQNVLKAGIRFVQHPAFNSFAESGLQKFLLVQTEGEIPACCPGGWSGGTNGFIASGFTMGSDFDQADRATLANKIRQLGVEYSALVVGTFGGSTAQVSDFEALNGYSGEIASFLNQGGGLLVLSQSDAYGSIPAGGLYGFLPFVASSKGLGHYESGNTLTEFGRSLGLNESDINGNFSHNIFLETSGLNVICQDPHGNVLGLAGRGIVTENGVISNPEAYVYQAIATDPDDDSVVYSLGNSPSGMYLDSRTGLLQWAPTEEQLGEHSITIQADDGRGGVAFQRYRVYVLPSNEAPRIDHADLDLAIDQVDAADLVVNGQTLLASGTVSARVVNRGPGPLTRPFEVLFFEDRNGNGRFDATHDLALGSSTVTNRLEPFQSFRVTALASGQALFPGSVIWAMVDSGQEISEADESNNLAQLEVDCMAEPSPGEFNPVIKYSALAGYNVVATPMVANLTDDNHDGVVDGRDIPDIIVPRHNGGQLSGGILVALSGDDGHILFEAGAPHEIAALAEIAVGDLDGDGPVEIVAAHADGRHLICFEHDGTLKWISDQHNLPGRLDSGGAISLADLDQDGIPEIVIGASVYDAQGHFLADGRDLGGTSGFSYYSAISAVADIDLDGTPEIIAGPTVYRLENRQLKIVWHREDLLDGFVGIANLDEDEYGEIVLVARGNVYTLNHDGSDVIGWQQPVKLEGLGYGGAPTIADLDGDGRPEIGLAGRSRYYVLKDGGILWSSPTVDYSSETTGSTAFDFEGDGRMEIVYRDEQYLRVYRGTDGKVLLQEAVRSGTATELPVVVDVDGDGNAEIVVTSSGFPGGVIVFGDRNDSWVSTRTIWNQHSYHITNVNDDGTIPRYERPSWLDSNTYRLNALPTRGAALAAPDLVASFTRTKRTNQQTAIIVRIGNGGALLAPSGIEVALYDGDPHGERKVVQVARTSSRMLPGSFEDITFVLSEPTTSEVWIVADDDGAGNGKVSECQEENNYFRTGIRLPPANPPPAFTSLPVENAMEGITYSYHAEARDDDAGDRVTYSLANAPTAMRMDADTGIIEWKPGASDAGYHWIAVQATDRQGATDVQQYLLHVEEALNAPPYFVSIPITRTPINANYQYDPLARDPDGDTLTFDLISAPAGMIIETNSGSLAWRPNLEQIGAHEIVLRASDGRGGVALHSFTLEVTLPNTAPVLISTLPPSARVGLLYTLQLEAQDAEGQAIFFSATNAPSGFDLNATNGVLTWTPVLEQVGTNQIEIIVADSEGASSSKTFPVVVRPSAVNNPPVFVTTPRLQTRFDLPWIYLARASDPDADPLTLTLAVSPDRMFLTNRVTGFDGSVRESPLNSQFVVWTPPVEAVGVANEVVLQADDGQGGVATQRFRIEVGNTLENSAPVIVSNPPRAATAGQTYEYDLVAEDADGDLLTWRLVAAPVGTSLNAATGALRWTPTFDQLGTNAFIVEVTDGLLGTDTQEFSVEVGGMNRPPSIVSTPPVATPKEAVYLYAARATDPDEDPLTWSLVEPLPPGMTVDPASGLIRWTIPENAGDSHIVRVRVTDDHGGSDTQTYTLYVTDERANKPPVITSTPARGTTAGREYTYAVTATDADGDLLTLQLLQPRDGATLVSDPPSAGRASGIIRWTPGPDQNGPHDFIVSVRDAAGASAGQRFSVLVRPNQPPRISSTPPPNAVPEFTYL